LRIASFAAVVLSLAIPSLANALTLECSMSRTNSGGGFISDVYVLQHDEASGKAIAADRLTQHFEGAPVDAKVTEDTAKKLVMTWSVAITNNAGQPAIMRFRATYFKATKKVTIRAMPGGYDNSFEGRGACKSI
jgi:hypothetical protein